MTPAIENPEGSAHLCTRSEKASLTDLPDAFSTVCSICDCSAPALTFAPLCKACLATVRVVSIVGTLVYRHLSAVYDIDENERNSAQGLRLQLLNFG